MPQPVGRKLPLSPPRRFIIDLVHFAKAMPLVSVERRVRLGPLVAARRAAVPRPGWCALFTKAYAIVAARRPELRRAYLPFPRPHLYEHPVNVASVGVEREAGGEEAVFIAHVRAPEAQPLARIDAHLRRCKEEPLKESGLSRRIQKLSRLPGPVRRLLWWVGLNTSGRRRAHHLGTFGVTSVAGLGAASVTLLSPLTTTLNYGVIGEDGEVNLRVTFDHRVFDGGPIARALEELEHVLRGEILAEVLALRAGHAA